VIERLALLEAGNSITRAVGCVPAVRVLKVLELGFVIQTVTAGVALFGACRSITVGTWFVDIGGPPAITTPLTPASNAITNATRTI